MTIKLTNSEWEILDHRLACVDALAECYADTIYCTDEDAGKTLTDEQHEAAYNMAHDVASALWDRISATREIDVAALTDIERVLIADCVDGSTFFADMDDAVARHQSYGEGDMSRGKALSLRKAGNSLERKLNEAGIECEMCWD